MLFETRLGFKEFINLIQWMNEYYWSCSILLNETVFSLENNQMICFLNAPLKKNLQICLLSLPSQIRFLEMHRARSALNLVAPSGQQLFGQWLLKQTTKSKVCTNGVKVFQNNWDAPWNGYKKTASAIKMRLFHCKLKTEIMTTY